MWGIQLIIYICKDGIFRCTDMLPLSYTKSAFFKILLYAKVVEILGFKNFSKLFYLMIFQQCDIFTLQFVAFLISFY